MARPLLVDGRNMLDPYAAARAGYEWVGIGRPQYAGDTRPSVTTDGACAMSWLDPVRRALDERPDPCPVFFRDDDAGRDDGRLAAMLDRFDAHRVGVDVAVIPALVARAARRRAPGAGSTRAACACTSTAWPTSTTSATGRKHEFGPSRGPARQVRGRGGGSPAAARLVRRGGRGPGVHAALEPVHARHRSGPAQAHGLRVLSRDHTAPPLALPGLAEVPVTLDWFGHRKGVRWTPAELAARLADQVRGRRPDRRDAAPRRHRRATSWPASTSWSALVARHAPVRVTVHRRAGRCHGAGHRYGGRCHEACTSATALALTALAGGAHLPVVTEAARTLGIELEHAPVTLRSGLSAGAGPVRRAGRRPGTPAPGRGVGRVLGLPAGRRGRAVPGEGRRPWAGSASHRSPTTRWPRPLPASAGAETTLVRYHPGRRATVRVVAPIGLPGCPVAYAKVFSDAPWRRATRARRTARRGGGRPGGWGSGSRAPPATTPPGSCCGTTRSPACRRPTC